MAKKKLAGFTLIEIIIVMAISSLLLLIAFIGQAGLRREAQFDAGVNQFASAMSDARNEATAGINLKGLGNGSVSCPGGTPTDPYVFAGTMLSFNSLVPGGAIRMSYYEAQEPKPGVTGTSACEIFTAARPLSLGLPDILASMGKPVGPTGAILFVRTPTAGLDVCYAMNLATANIYPSFAAGGCTGGATSVGTLAAGPGPAGTAVINIQDNSGHVAHVYVDASGLAQRHD